MEKISSYNYLCDVHDAITDVKEDLKEMTSHVDNLFESLYEEIEDYIGDHAEVEQLLLRIQNHIKRQTKRQTEDLETANSILSNQISEALYRGFKAEQLQQALCNSLKEYRAGQDAEHAEQKGASTSD